MTIIFEERFLEDTLNQNLWNINKVGFIAGYPIPAIHVYHITDADPNFLIDGSSKGNQHEAKVPIPDNCDINFDVAISDPEPSMGGQAGVALVKESIEGLSLQEDNEMLLFVGQEDADRSGTSPTNAVIGSTSLSIMNGNWNYADGTNKLVSALDSEMPMVARYKIEKRGSNYSVYNLNQLVCTTTFNGTVRLSIAATTLDPCLWFLDWAELQNIYIDAF
jgi:hypothetical protein